MDYEKQVCIPRKAFQGHLNQWHKSRQQPLLMCSCFHVSGTTRAMLVRLQATVASVLSTVAVRGCSAEKPPGPKLADASQSLSRCSFPASVHEPLAARRQCSDVMSAHGQIGEGWASNAVTDMQARLSRFQGANAISSADFYDNGEGGGSGPARAGSDFDITAGDLVNRLSMQV